ncbi:MAG: class II aldolase/adducin family protein [Acidimicrobiia bacterium]
MSTTEKPPGFEDSAFEKAAVSIDLPPSFDTVAEEREYRKVRLAGALRIIGSLGFAEGVAGHITARDPEHTDHFWVNPFGKSFRQMTVSDLILVNPDGDVVSGTRPVNAAAYAIPNAIHTARPEVVCAVHTHSIYGKAFASTNLDLKMLSQDACMFYNDWVRHREGGGAIVVDLAESSRMAEALIGKKALIHQNHGLITVGETVDEAAWWFMALERACQVQMIAEAGGEVTEVPAESAQFSYDQSGFPLAGWFQFQPHWEDMVARDGIGWQS